MDFFAEKFFGMAGVKRAKMTTDSKHQEELAKYHEDMKRDKFSGVPAIPLDIGFKSTKEVGGSRSSGASQNALGNPAVILGMGLTTLALLGMFKKSFAGDKLGAQKYMRYRIMAQFFTVTALVAGVTIFGSAIAETPKKANVQ